MLHSAELETCQVTVKSTQNLILKIFWRQKNDQKGVTNYFRKGDLNEF